jgi:hypothetical protein
VDLSDVRDTCGELPAPVGCSYSSSVTERPVVPDAAQSGEHYLLLFTNFANVPQDVRLVKTGGPGTTACDIIPPPPSTPPLPPLPPPSPPSPSPEVSDW